MQPDEIYRGQGRSGWTALRRDAGLLSTTEGPEDEYFGHRFSDLLHYNDPEQIHLLTRLSEPGVHYQTLTDGERRRLQMLAYQVDGQHHQTGSGEAFLTRLSQTPEIYAELGELGGVLQARSNLRFRPVPGLSDVPLCLHASYGIREILTAVGWLTAERRTPFQAGVLPLQNRKVELLFSSRSISQRVSMTVLLTMITPSAPNSFIGRARIQPDLIRQPVGVTLRVPTTAGHSNSSSAEAKEIPIRLVAQ